MLLAAFALVAVVEAAAAETAGSQVCVDAAIDAIQKRYESISDFRAEFVQTARSVALSGAGGSGVNVSRGTAVFAKPGKMRC